MVISYRIPRGKKICRNSYIEMREKERSASKDMKISLRRTWSSKLFQQALKIWRAQREPPYRVGNYARIAHSSCKPYNICVATKFTSNLKAERRNTYCVLYRIKKTVINTGKNMFTNFWTNNCWSLKKSLVHLCD